MIFAATAFATAAILPATTASLGASGYWNIGAIIRASDRVTNGRLQTIERPFWVDAVDVVKIGECVY